MPSGSPFNLFGRCCLHLHPCAVALLLLVVASCPGPLLASRSTCRPEGERRRDGEVDRIGQEELRAEAPSERPCLESVIAVVKRANALYFFYCLCFRAKYVAVQWGRFFPPLVGRPHGSRETKLQD